MLQKLITW